MRCFQLKFERCFDRSIALSFSFTCLRLNRKGETGRKHMFSRNVRLLLVVLAFSFKNEQSFFLLRKRASVRETIPFGLFRNAFKIDVF